MERFPYLPRQARFAICLCSRSSARTIFISSHQSDPEVLEQGCKQMVDYVKHLYGELFTDLPGNKTRLRRKFSDLDSLGLETVTLALARRATIAHDEVPRALFTTLASYHPRYS